MKKHLTSLFFSLIGLATLRADVMFKDNFNYADGPIIVVGTNLDGSTNWFHTGSATATDFLVKNHKAEISATGGTNTSRAEDVHCNFSTFTNAQTIVYASFTVNCTNPPAAQTTYFAHFYTSATVFHARVFALAGTLPNTWRLGVSGAAGSPNQIVSANLAVNTDYQVVLQWDPTGFNAATLWVNPISATDPNVITSDLVTPVAPADALGFGFRQASSFGSFFAQVTNLVVATSFDEATTNVWATNAVAPVILIQPKGGTNFVGDTLNLISLASGQGLLNLTYQWQKDGQNISNPLGNTNVFSQAGVAAGDSGDYRMIATTPFGMAATSAVATMWITNAPVKPTISQSPSNVSVFYHQSVSLHVVASGPPPLSYLWYYTNAPATGANVSGADSDTLTISDVFTNNGTTGEYYAVVSNPYGNTTSLTAVVTSIGPPAVSIAFLRTLVDPVNFVATNSTLRWQATGTVTTFTNLTTGDTSSYYLQDGTGGINIFVTHGHDFRPALGDVVTFTGWLSSFNSTLELEGDTNDLTTGFNILSNNIAGLPAPKVIPFSITNDLAYCETNLEGRIVMLTNVYFTTNTIINTNANTVVTVTNSTGETFTLLFSSQDLDVTGQTVPLFAWTVSGPMTQNLGNAVNPRNQGYQVTVTRFSDIVTDAPPPVTLTAARAGNNVNLSWTAVGYKYSYSVQAATNVTGPYLPVATGLTFTNGNGSYTDSNAGGDAKFYRVVSP